MAQYFTCALMLLTASAMGPGPGPYESNPDARIELARYHHHRRAPRPATQEPMAAPFTTEPVFKCDGGTDATATHIDFIAFADSRVSGAIERIVRGELTSTPLEAKYARRGTEVVVYRETWKEVPRDPASRSLGHSEFRPDPIFRMVWDGKDNKWTAKMLDSQVVMRCLDWSKGGVND